MAWVDGSPITFAAFMETAPFPITGTGNNSNTCVMALYDGRAYFWINSQCSDQYPAICRAKGEAARGLELLARLARKQPCSLAPRKQPCSSTSTAAAAATAAHALQRSLGHAHRCMRKGWPAACGGTL